jgi:hypothetical protein
MGYALRGLAGKALMMYEYKIVPAPTKGVRKRGMKTHEARFATALEDLFNDLAGEGWEYLRSDAFPSEERKGLTGTRTVTRHMLIFRRSLDAYLAEAPQAEAATPSLRAVEETPKTDLPKVSARREDPAIARPVRNLFARRGEERSD